MPEDGRKVAGKIGDVRAAPMPERPAVGNAPEGEHLLHSAVAIRGDEEDAAVGESDDDVVMELPLRPMIDELVAAVACAQLVE